VRRVRRAIAGHLTVLWVSTPLAALAGSTSEERRDRGQVIALASDNGAPDGCHLHVEKRAPGGGLDTATYPRGLLGLAAVVT
jgi:hypothetical protein